MSDMLKAMADALAAAQARRPAKFARVLKAAGLWMEPPFRPAAKNFAVSIRATDGDLPEAHLHAAASTLCDAADGRPHTLGYEFADGRHVWTIDILETA